MTPRGAGEGSPFRLPDKFLMHPPRCILCDGRMAVKSILDRNGTPVEVLWCEACNHTMLFCSTARLLDERGA